MVKKAHHSYQWLAWSIVGYTLLVIMFGAFVRATGSGAGCGDHWPLCNGQVIPRPEDIETIIEFTHRITSGWLMIMILVGFVWAFRKFPKGHAIRHGATLSLIFVIIEAAIGAGLVLLQLVEDNATPLRAVAVGAHLFNTFLLLAVMTYTAWYASRGYVERFRIRAKGRIAFMIIAGLILYGVVGATGAITALGDTLFPIGSLSAEAAGTHFLVQLRVIHPILAVVVSFFILWLAGFIRSEGALPHVNRTSYWLQIGVVTQLIGGVVNILLLAPTWMQLVHLLVADVVMILFVIVSMESLSLAPLFKPGRKSNQQSAIGMQSTLT